MPSLSEEDIKINLKWCWQRCPSSWGRLLAEIRESSPIVPESGRILAELRQSPLLSNLHPPPARVAGYFRRRGRGREPPDPSFRVTCPLKCHGAHQLYEAPLFLVSCPTKKYSTAMCSLVPCTPFLEKVQNDTSFTLDVEDNADQESATLGDSLLSRTSTT